MIHILQLLFCSHNQEFLNWEVLTKNFFRGGFTKNQYIEGNCQKMGAWIVCRFKAGSAKKKKKNGVVFYKEGLINIPMHTM